MLKLNQAQLNVLKLYITISRIEAKVTFYDYFYEYSNNYFNELIDKTNKYYNTFIDLLSLSQRKSFLAIQEEIESEYTLTLIDFETYKQFLETV